MSHYVYLESEDLDCYFLIRKTIMLPFWPLPLWTTLAVDISKAV